MSGINPGVMLAVCQVVVEFRDDIGNPPKVISGTGFWVQDKGSDYFITNRHNLDPTLKLGAGSPFRLASAQVQLRLQAPPGEWQASTKLFPVNNLETCVRLHPSADVAALKNPSLTQGTSQFSHSTFTRDELATPQLFVSSVSPMDVASFIGFPGKDGAQWWDQSWNLPISRTVHIASWPRIPFSNSSIPTPDVTLVSGLSFSGSSGSPVLLHRKGIRLGAGLTGGGNVEPKILGIMSGHWWDEEPSSGMFFHSGLSYFTRTTAICELLDA
jgi:hypothetical protein